MTADVALALLASAAPYVASFFLGVLSLLVVLRSSDSLARKAGVSKSTAATEKEAVVEPKTGTSSSAASGVSSSPVSSSPASASPSSPKTRRPRAPVDKENDSSSSVSGSSGGVGKPGRSKGTSGGKQRVGTRKSHSGPALGTGAGSSSSDSPSSRDLAAIHEKKASKRHTETSLDLPTIASPRLNESQEDALTPRRRGHRRTGSNSSDHSRGSRSSRKGGRSDRSLRSHASSPSALSPIQESRVLVLPEHKQLRAWLDLGRKHRGTVTYKRMFFALKYPGWLQFWNDERELSHMVCGFICLQGCAVYEDLAHLERPKIVVKGKGKIFRKSGPDPDQPSANSKYFKRHRKSHTVRLQTDHLSQQDRELWLEHLKANASGEAANFSDGSGSEGSSDMYHMMGASSDEAIQDDHERNSSLLTQNLAVTDPDHGKVIVVRGESLINPAEGAERTESPTPGDAQAESPTPGKKLKRRSSQRKRVGSTTPAKADVVEVVGPAASATQEDVGELDAGMSADQEPEKRDGLMKLLANAVGLDVTTIAIPVTYNEPTSFLQRMCEVVQYYDLLNKADQCEDPSHAAAFVAAFAMSFYHVNTRISKPFNPLLGETFEYQEANDGTNLRGDKPFTPGVPFQFVAEQVSHHPPIGASFCHTKHFEFTQTQGLKTKFGGNSLSAESLGACEVRLLSSGKRFVWGGVKTVIHNVIIGSTWVDHYGDMNIFDGETNEVVAKIEMKKCGWFGKNRHQIKAWTLEGGKSRVALTGTWEERIEAKAVKGPAFKVPGAKDSWADPQDSSCVWRRCEDSQPDSSNKWKLPQYAQSLVHVTDDANHQAPAKPENAVDIKDVHERSLLAGGFFGNPRPTTLLQHGVLPRTDARLRPDRAALEVWETKKAGNTKAALEQVQRARKKAQEAAGAQHRVRFFEPRANNGDFLLYDFNGKYESEKFNDAPELW